MPGFPVMAWPMIEWVLDTHYSALFHQSPRLERSVQVFDAMESALAPLMVAIEADFPLVKVFSLPSVGDARTRACIELGVKGEPEQTAAAYARLVAELDRLHAEYQPN